MDKTINNKDLKNIKQNNLEENSWFKPRKKTITIRLDIDVIVKYKSLGKGYQTKMNADLRKAVFQK